MNYRKAQTPPDLFMKPNQQTTPPAPDWTRAKSLLSELKISVRRSLSAQVLLGKELATIKRRLFPHGGVRKGSSGHDVHLKTWDQWCKGELGICARTGNRWIDCFDLALERAKKRKCTEPQAARLLEIPADELTGDELEALAQVVQGLVAGDTQAGLLEELRIVKRSNSREGGDTSQNRNGAEAAFEQMVKDMFSKIRSGSGDLEKRIYRGCNGALFHAALEKLPLESEDKDAPTLSGIRDELSGVLDDLRGVLDGELPKMLKSVDLAIKEYPNKDAKPSRLKPAKA